MEKLSHFWIFDTNLKYAKETILNDIILIFNKLIGSQSRFGTGISGLARY